MVVVNMVSLCVSLGNTNIMLPACPEAPFEGVPEQFCRGIAGIRSSDFVNKVNSTADSFEALKECAIAPSTNNISAIQPAAPRRFARNQIPWITRQLRMMHDVRPVHCVHRRHPVVQT